MAAISIPESPELGRFNVIDGSNFLQYADDPATRSLRGYEGRNYHKHPYGSMPYGASPYPKIPRHEWQARIEEGHAKKTFPIYHNLRKKVPIKNQRKTNYCWINSVVGAIQAARAMSGLPTVALSSASAGAPGKGYQNVGGWTGEAITMIAKYGLVPETQWPNDAIESSYFRGTRAVAQQYNIGQWFELRRRDFDELMTCLLLNIPVAVGLPWWGHSVWYSAPIWDGGPGVIDDNSWGPEWENKGRSILMEEKANAEEANAISSAKLDGDYDKQMKRYADFYASLRLAS